MRSRTLRSLQNAEQASSQRRLQNLPPQMKLRSLSGRVAQGEAGDSEYFAWPLIKFFPLPQQFEQVQGEGLPSDGFAHRDGCNALEQSSGAAEECDDIEAPLSFSCSKVYS